jgi:hypothetical protein
LIAVLVGKLTVKVYGACHLPARAELAGTERARKGNSIGA